MSVLHRGAVAALATVAAVSTGLASSPSAQAVDVSSDVVISEVYGGGGNSGAPYRNDFIELSNRGTTAVSLAGWSVQYAGATGTAFATTTLSGSIAPGGFYLVAEAAGASTTAPALPMPDVVGTLAMSGTSGKVALVNVGTALTGCAAACSTAAGVVDFVGYGAANDAAGGHPTPATSNTTSAQRTLTPFTNTGDNLADFTVAAPTPKAVGATPPAGKDCSATPTPAECVPGPTTVQDVQGDGFVSPLDTATVDKVAGIVTAVRTSGRTRGFWVQQTAPDPTRTSASSALFVFSSSVVPTVGDSVLVSGAVSDFYPLSSGETVSTTASLSTTEITPTTVTTLSRGNPVPAALVLTPTTVPDSYAPVVAGGKVESIAAVNPAATAMEFWEAHEGMLVQVSDARVVGPGKPKFGEIYVTTRPADHATPRGGAYLGGYTDVPTGRLRVSPTNGLVPAANVGDELTGVTSGPVEWSGFGGYGIAATTLGAHRDNRLAASTARPAAADQLSVATYNVENLAPGDTDAKYAQLGAGVVTNLRSPDVITLEEIQDNSGALNDGTVAAEVTLGKLAAAITAAGGPAYTWSGIDPVDGRDGGQPGGNIRVAFLYNAERVTLAPGTKGDSTTAVTAATTADGTAGLSLNPGRVDPTNPAWTSSRKPLAGEFLFHGRKVIVVANHFNSKGGDQSADGRFQPPDRSSEVQRGQQATVLNTFVKQVLAADPGANIVIAGDLNDYQFSPSVQRLTDNGATLTDLITTLPANERYTYVFNGVSQVLDHILLSKAVTDAEYDVVHLNAEFSVQSSDHDPQVTRIRPSVRTGTVALDPASVVVGGATQVTLAGWYPNRAFSVSLDTAVAGMVTTDGTGAATFAVPVPAGTTTGAHTVTVVSDDGATASAPLSVTAVPVRLGTVKVSPARQDAGKSVAVTMDGFAPNAPLSVSIDGGPPLASVTTGASGHARSAITVPRTTSVGAHQVRVTASDGGSVSTALEVRTECVPKPGRGAAWAEIVTWLIAVIAGRAC